MMDFISLRQNVRVQCRLARATDVLIHLLAVAGQAYTGTHCWKLFYPPQSAQESHFPVSRW
jgi:hypothetical protein